MDEADIVKFLNEIEEKMSMLSYKKGLPLVVVIIFLFTLAISFGATGFTNMGGNSFLYSGSTSSAFGDLYADGLSGNQNVGLEICNQVTPQYVGGFYAINVGGSWSSVPVTYGSGTEWLGHANINVGGGCYQTTQGDFTVSPSALSLIPTRFAAYPGQLVIGYATSPNPASVTNFEFEENGAVLGGSFNFNQIFDQATSDITISSPTASMFRTSGTLSSQSLETGLFALSSSNPVVIGVCNDEFGQNCESGDVYSSDVFPLALDTGLGTVNDQAIHTRYSVINGLGTEMCIGANLRGLISTVSPDPIYFSQNLTISFSVFNTRPSGSDDTSGGNVEVTTDFNVFLEIYPQGNPGSPVYTETIPVTENLLPSASVFRSLTWNANVTSGDYTVRITTDSDDDIAECVEGSTNQDSENFEVKPITIPTVYIDGVETNEFATPNVPAVLNITLANSDGLILSDAQINLTELNGMSILTPTQIYNHTAANGTQILRGPVTTTVSSLKTDINGSVIVTVIPAFDRFFESQYQHLDVESTVGSYQLFFVGEQSDGEDFIFVERGELFDYYNFTFTDYSAPLQTPSKDIVQESYVAQAMDFVYRTFVQFVGAITQ